MAIGVKTLLGMFGLHIGVCDVGVWTLPPASAKPEKQLVEAQGLARN